MIWRWLFVLLLLAHGGIHLLGFLGPTGIADIDGLPREATFLLADFEVGSPPLVALGALWLVPAIGFIGSAIGVAARQAWWPPLALASAAISTGLVVLWWDDALVGLVPNVIAAAGAIGALQRH